MTTTRILFDPYASAAQANGYSRYDLEGTVKDTRLNETFVGRANAFVSGMGEVEKGNHRINNNTYDWVVVMTSGFEANDHKIILDATNWTLDSNTGVTISNVGVATITSQDYTFPGGGTISGNNRGIAVRGRYLANRAYDFGDNVLVEYTLATHQGNVATLFARSPDVAIAAAPGYSQTTVDTEVVFQYGPYNTYYITPSENTAANVKFFAHAGHRTRSIGDFNYRDTSLEFFYDYEWRNVWEVNLHSGNCAISIPTRVGTRTTDLVTKYFAESGEYFDSEYITSGYTTANETYTVTGYVADEIEIQLLSGVVATIGKFAQVTTAATSQLVSSSRLTIASAQIQNTITNTLTARAGFVQSAACSITATTTAQFSAGVVYAGAAAGQIATEFTASGNRTPGGTVSETATTTSTAQATNIIGISDGRGYVTIDYAESDYFPEGQGLEIAQSVEILADANVIASDGSITFDGAFDAVIRPGFRIDGSVTAAGAGDFTIAPYITGGVGLLFAGAADLQAQAQVSQALFGLRIDAAAAFAPTASQIQVLAGNRIESPSVFAPVLTQLVSDAESRPSIKVSIEIGDAGRLAAEAFIDTSSSARLDIGPFTAGPAQGGYLLSADVQIQQQITSTFGTTEARIFYIDMYYTTVVAAENRRYRTGSEARLFLADSETRVNTNLEETRQILVDPETRQAEIAILPTTLRDKKLFRIPA
jgi:hypothetical protein